MSRPHYGVGAGAVRLAGRCRGRSRGRSRGSEGGLVAPSAFLLAAPSVAGDPPGAVVVIPVLLPGVEELAFVLVAEATQVRGRRCRPARLLLLREVVHHRPLRLTASHVCVGRDGVLLQLTLVSPEVESRVSLMMVVVVVKVVAKVGERVGGVGRMVGGIAPRHPKICRMMG